MREVRLLGIGHDTDSGQQVVLLQETGGRHRVLPMWIGDPEATEMELAAEGGTGARRGPHELIGTLITICGRRLRWVAITMLRDTVFHAELVLDGDTRISARPSDAVILALRLEAPISVADGVLDAAAVDPSAVIDADGGSFDRASDPPGASIENEVEEMRRLLDGASPEDFELD